MYTYSRNLARGLRCTLNIVETLQNNVLVCVVINWWKHQHAGNTAKSKTIMKMILIHKYIGVCHPHNTPNRSLKLTLFILTG